MFILKTGHQPGVYVPFRALFLVTKKNITAPLNLLHFAFHYNSLNVWHSLISKSNKESNME